MRFLFALFLGGLMSSTVMAQDMPLSQILIPGHGWVKGPGSISLLASSSKGDLGVVSSQGSAAIQSRSPGTFTKLKQQVPDASAITFDANGNLHVCREQTKDVSLWKMETPDALVPKIKDLKVSAIVFTADGVAFCAVPEEKTIYRISPEGKKTIAYKGEHAFARLVLWSKDGTLVAAPKEGSHLWTFRIDEEGKLVDGDKYYPLRLASGKKTTVIGTMTLDARGRLYAATGEGVQVFDPTGRFSGAMVMPGNQIPTQVAFGGKDLDTFYVATAKALYSRQLKAKRVVRSPGK